MEYLTSKGESVTWPSIQFSYPTKLITAEILKNIKKEEICQDEFRDFINNMHPPILFELEEPSSISDFELIDRILENSWVSMYILKSKIEQEEKLIEESLNYFVVIKYLNFEFVNSIFFQQYKKELRYYIFFESEHYDSNKMKQLISAELEIMDLYPDLYINIMYFPANIENDVCPFGKSAVKIY